MMLEKISVCVCVCVCGVLSRAGAISFRFVFVACVHDFLYMFARWKMPLNKLPSDLIWLYSTSTPCAHMYCKVSVHVFVFTEH